MKKNQQSNTHTSQDNSVNASEILMTAIADNNKELIDQLLIVNLFDDMVFKQKKLTIFNTPFPSKYSPLEYAAFLGRYEIFVRLVEVGASLTTNDTNSRNFLGILYHACLCKDAEQKKLILTWLKDNFEKYELNKDGITIAHIEAALGEKESSDEHLKSTPDRFGLYPFHYAALSGEVDYKLWVPEGLEKYESITGQDIFAGIDLHWLVARGRRDSYSLPPQINLTAKPLSPHHMDFGVTTAQLVFTNQENGFNILQEHIQKYPETILDFTFTSVPYGKQIWPPFALQLVKTSGYYKFLRKYLQDHPEVNVDLNMKDESRTLEYMNGVTLAWVMTFQGDLDLLRQLSATTPNLENAKSLDETYSNCGKSIAWFFAIFKKWYLVQNFLDPKDIEDTAPTHDLDIDKGVTIPWTLANYQDWKSFENLIDQGFPINLNAKPLNKKQESAGITLAWILIVMEKWALLHKLIDQGNIFDLDAFDERQGPSGKTLAWLLAVHNQWEILDKLINRGVRFNLDTKPLPGARDEGVTFAFMLITEDKWDLLEKLIDKGFLFDLNAHPKHKDRGDFGVTVGLALVAKRRSDLLEKLIDRGVPVDLDAYPLCPRRKDIETVATRLVQDEKFRILEKCFDRGNRFNLNSILLNDLNQSTGMTLAWSLAFKQQWSFLEKIADAGIVIDLSAAWSDPSLKKYAISVRNLLENRPAILKKFENNAKGHSSSAAQSRPTQSKTKPKSKKKQGLARTKANVPSAPPKIAAPNLYIQEELAKRIEKNLENLENEITNLSKKEKIINAFKEVKKYNDNKVPSGKHVKKYASEIGEYQKLLEEKYTDLSKHQEKLKQIFTSIAVLKKNDFSNTEYSNLKLILNELEKNVDEDLKKIANLEGKISDAQKKLQKNIEIERKSTFPTKKQSKRNSNSKATKQSRNRKGKGNQARPVAKKDFNASEKKVVAINVEAPIQPTIETQDLSIPAVPMPAPIQDTKPTASAKGKEKEVIEKEVEFIPGKSLASSLISQSTLFANENVERDFGKKTKRTFLDYKNEIETRMVHLFSSIFPTEEECLSVAAESEFIMKLNLLKFCEACYHLEDSTIDIEEITYLKGFRNLICHDPLALNKNEVLALIDKFKCNVEMKESEKEKPKEEDEPRTVPAVDCIKALARAIITSEVKEKIDDFKAKKSTCSIGDFVYQEFLKKRLNENISQLQAEFMQIQEDVAKEAKGNALAHIRNLSSNRYAKCEFLIASTYELLSKLNYSLESNIIRDLRNHICHEFEPLPVNKMQKFFGRHLPLILELLEKRKFELLPMMNLGT